MFHFSTMGFLLVAKQKMQILERSCRCNLAFILQLKYFTSSMLIIFSGEKKVLVTCSLLNLQLTAELLSVRAPIQFPLQHRPQLPILCGQGSRLGGILKWISSLQTLLKDKHKVCAFSEEWKSNLQLSGQDFGMDEET